MTETDQITNDPNASCCWCGYPLPEGNIHNLLFEARGDISGRQGKFIPLTLEKIRKVVHGFVCEEGSLAKEIDPRNGIVFYCCSAPCMNSLAAHAQAEIRDFVRTFN